MHLRVDMQYPHPAWDMQLPHVATSCQYGFSTPSLKDAQVAASDSPVIRPKRRRSNNLLSMDFLIKKIPKNANTEMMLSLSIRNW